MKRYIITKNKELTGRKYKVVFKEKTNMENWVLIEVGEELINGTGWLPNKVQVEKYNLNPSHYYYWVSSFKFVNHLEEVEV